MPRTVRPSKSTAVPWPRVATSTCARVGPSDVPSPARVDRRGACSPMVTTPIWLSTQDSPISPRAVTAREAGVVLAEGAFWAMARRWTPPTSPTRNLRVPSATDPPRTAIASC